MDTNQPSQDDKDLVDRNQQISQDKTPPDAPVGPPPVPPALPPSTTSPNPPAAPPPSAPPPAPTPPTPAPPLSDNIPLQQPNEHNVGVGTPNIGIEEKQVPPTPPPAEPTEKEETPSPSPPPSEPSASDQNEDEKIEIADYNNHSKPEPPEPPAPAEKNEAAATPVQVKNYQNPAPTATPITPQPPVKASNSNTPLVVFILVALIVGSAGGFFGFRYWDNLKTSASVEPSSELTKSPSLTVSTWQNYTSALHNFSLKYPYGWASSTNDPKAESLVFAANEESLTGEPTGYKVEINFQNSNGQTLKNWVEANTAAMGEKNAAKEITVSGQTAYQQELSKTGPKIATYVARGDKIMIITYSAPENVFGEGGQWYNNLIDSINLT